MNQNTTKITVTNDTGVAVLTKASDGKWDITVNGICNPALHFDTEQVEKMIATGGLKGTVVYE